MSQITAKVIADSVAPDGSRLTSLQLRYHRYIHGEFMTHRVFSRSASSSRAIPIRKVLAQVWSDPAIPVKWGSHQPGMQSGAPLQGWKQMVARGLWKTAGKFACMFAWGMMKVGLAKEVANRILEPWQLINVIVTATDFKNFFYLRDHPDAQPEIRMLASLMWWEMKNSTPTQLADGDWHLPYVRALERERFKGTADEWKLPAISAARCARVSFNLHDGSNPSVAKDLNLFERLVISAPPHASPTEHQAQVDSGIFRSRNFQGAWEQFREILEINGWGPYSAVGDTSEPK